MRKLVLAAAVGAAVMWFCDPANGTQRREDMKRQLEKFNGSGARSSAELGQDDGDRNDVAMLAAR